MIGFCAIIGGAYKIGQITEGLESQVIKSMILPFITGIEQIYKDHITGQILPVAFEYKGSCGRLFELFGYVAHDHFQFADQIIFNA